MMREKYIDIVKGLSILCITFLHYEEGILPSCVNVFIGSFMITTFYVTAGWVSAMHPSTRTLKELVRKRWKQLGVPYLWWTIIILMFDCLLLGFGYYDFRYIGTEIYKTITLRGIGTLWFLPALFGGEIIWYMLKKRSVWFILLAFVLTLIYLYAYGQIFGGKTEDFYRIIDAPFRTIKNVLQAWICIAFGFYAYRRLENILSKTSSVVKIFTGLAFCSLAFVLANYLPYFLAPLWGIFAPLLGPLGWLFLAQVVQKWRFTDFLSYWGVNSLNLMVTHYSIVMILFTIVVEYVLNQRFYGWITIFCFILSLPIQYLLVFIINRYAKITLGK